MLNTSITLDYQMNNHHNALNQQLGEGIQDWQPCPYPPHQLMEGRFCRLEPLDPSRHAEELFAANSLDVEGENWRYLFYGPFDDLGSYRAWLEQTCCGSDPQFFAIIDKHKKQAVGVASYLRIQPEIGCIEVGHINYSPLLQRTPAATEAMYLMMKHSFDLGYRRYEWKCNSLNEASRKAAKRLGFTFEGIFRQATISKGRNRDTAWYSIIDKEWPEIQKAFQQWLDLENFDEYGMQKKSLSTFMNK